MLTRLLLIGATLLAAAAFAADAPQFRGPNRDGKYAETKLLKAWPEGGPALAWKAEGVGRGYSSVSISKGTVYTAGMLEDNQGYLFAFDLGGKLKWKSAYGPETQEKQAPGSRSTPTIDGDRAYILSGDGLAACLSTKDGKALWTVNAFEKFKGAAVDWVYSESLLVDGDKVFVTPGGPDASVVALNKMTGETIWTSKGLSEASAYCSPTIFTYGKQRVLVTLLKESINGLDVDSGTPLWSHHQKVPYDIHANTPVGAGNILYYTAESGGGALDVAADGKSVKQRWTSVDPEVLHHGVILQDGYIYGGGFRKNRKLFCIELATGKEMWSSPEIGEASIVYADGMLYLYESPKKGIVDLVKASPEKYERSGTFQMPQEKDKHWAHPAIADGKLFLRYNGVLYAYDIAAK